MKKQYATGQLVFFAIITLLPLIQHFFHPFKLAGLQGAFEKGMIPELTASEWFSGTYQERKLSLVDISHRHIIVIIATGPSLKDFGYNFFEQLNELRVHE